MGGDCPGAAFRYTNSPYGFGNLVDGVTDVFIGTDPSDEGSGSQSRMTGFMGDVPLMDPPESWRIVSMGGLVCALAGYDNRPNGLGYSFRYYATQMIEGADVKLLAIDGVEPTVEHIADGS